MRKYRKGSASAAEEAFVKKYFAFLDHHEPAGLKESVEQLDVERGLADLHERIEEAERVHTIPPYRRLWRYAAAAVFILTAAAAIWLFLPGRRTENSQVAKQGLHISDVQPGSTAATLTLSDGSKILLDSAGTGVLAREDNTLISKDNGQLVYHTGEAGQGTSLNTLTTGRAQQYQVILPDGSRVWLNAASSLRFPAAFAGAQRTVELTGEGYFEVSHDAKKPFYVKVAGMEVEVLGTHFNINAYDDEPVIKTTLLEGAVKVSGPGRQVLLSPGQDASYSGGEIKVQNNADIGMAVAWKNGVFEFNDASIETVMRQIARWYDVTVEYKGRISQRFTGSIYRNSRASEVFKILEENGTVHFTIDGKNVIVQP